MMRVLLLAVILVIAAGVWESQAERLGSEDGPAQNVKTAVSPQITVDGIQEGEGDGGGSTASLKNSKGEKANSCTRTFANVKRYLLKRYKGKVPLLSGKCAYHAETVLPAAKFRPTGTNLENSTVDTVCVFGGGHFECDKKPVGTIAVRTKSGWYDGCSKDPSSELKTRPLLGCYKYAEK